MLEVKNVFSTYVLTAVKRSSQVTCFVYHNPTLVAIKTKSLWPFSSQKENGFKSLNCDRLVYSSWQEFSLKKKPQLFTVTLMITDICSAQFY